MYNHKNNDRLINGLLLPHLNRVANNIKQKDILSILYLVLFANILMFSLSLVSKGLKPLWEILELNFINIYNIMDAFINQKESFIQYQINLDYFIKYFFEDIDTIVVNILPVIVCIVIGFIFNKKNFKSITALLLFTILVYTIFFNIYLQMILIIIVVIMLVNFYPTGSGIYFKIIQHLNYIENIIYDYFEDRSIDKNTKTVSILQVIVISVSFFGMIYLFVKMFSISVSFSMLLTLLILLFLWLHKSKDKQEIYILKKALIYFVFYIFTLLGNVEVDLNFIKFPLSFITIFFALERVISLSKEIHSLIISKSVLYYYEYEDIENIDLIQNLIELNYLKKISVSETELVKQMMIRLRLNLTDEFLNLAKLYEKKEFQNYRQMIEGSSYFIKFNEFGNNNSNEKLHDLKNQVHHILSFEKQRIILPQLYEEYAVILFYLEEYEEAIYNFELYIWHLGNESIELLCEAYKRTGNIDRATKLRKQLLC